MLNSRLLKLRKKKVHRTIRASLLDQASTIILKTSGGLL
jgi:hypothetical protein